jgi:1-acyl-sn-glycerol-3-phosphate acyltransferase
LRLIILTLKLFLKAMIWVNNTYLNKMNIERLSKINPLRKILYAVIGVFTYPGIAIINRIKISGTEYLRNLPKKNVLFVSNHQTYFADVIAFIHVFCAVKWRKINKLGIPYYLLNPFSNVNFVAAEETMKDSIISRLFALCGAVTVKRTWRAGGKDIQRDVDANDFSKIYDALKRNWVITFPQGTTRPFAQGRKGTAHIIKENKPIVIPVVINGFWRAFTRKGLSFKKKGTLLSIRFKEPLDIDYSASVDSILETVMDAIEQSKKFMLKGGHHQLEGAG